MRYFLRGININDDEDGDGDEGDYGDDSDDGDGGNSDGYHCHHHQIRVMRDTAMQSSVRLQTGAMSSFQRQQLKDRGPAQRR